MEELKEKQAKAANEWRKAHPEQRKEINKRASQKYREKQLAENPDEYLEKRRKSARESMKRNYKAKREAMTEEQLERRRAQIREAVRKKREKEKAAKAAAQQNKQDE